MDGVRGRKRTAEIMVALCSWGTVRIRIPHEALPLIGVVVAHFVGSEAVPYAGVDLGHLWPLHDLDSGRRGGVIWARRQEGPGRVVGAPAGRRPDLAGRK